MIWFWKSSSDTVTQSFIRAAFEYCLKRLDHWRVMAWGLSRWVCGPDQSAGGSERCAMSIITTLVTSTKLSSPSSSNGDAQLAAVALISLQKWVSATVECDSVSGKKQKKQLLSIKCNVLVLCCLSPLHYFLCWIVLQLCHLCKASSLQPPTSASLLLTIITHVWNGIRYCHCTVYSTVTVLLWCYDL